MAGCIDRSDEQEIQEQKGIRIENPNFTLGVTNQAWGTVDLLIFIDDLLVVNDDFIQDQHLRIYYEFNLSRSLHSLMVYSERDNYTVSDSFNISEPIWLIVNYWGNSSARDPITLKVWNYNPPII